MAKTLYTNVFYIGFNTETDVSTEMALEYEREFVELQNMFADILNPLLDSINDTWDRYELIKTNCKYMDEDEYAKIACAAMEVEENATYYDWIEKWVKINIQSVNEFAKARNYKIELSCTRPEKDDFPIVFGKVRDHDGWYLAFDDVKEK